MYAHKIRIYTTTHIRMCTTTHTCMYFRMCQAEHSFGTCICTCTCTCTCTCMHLICEVSYNTSPNILQSPFCANTNTHIKDSLSLSLSLSLSPFSLYLYLHRFLYLRIYLSPHRFLYLCIYLSICLSICISTIKPTDRNRSRVLPRLRKYTRVFLHEYVDHRSFKNSTAAVVHVLHFSANEDCF
jgi:hypothetical protein